MRRGLLAVAAIASLGVALLVAYGKHCIQRGARWTGFSLDDGVALVFVCDPQSRILHAHFHIWPWNRVELEKMDTGA